MKIIQSFWGNALMENIVRRTNGGWPEKKYCYMSQALSCLQIAKFHGEVELITDTEGKRLLSGEMGLPYTSIRVDLDILQDYPGECWPIKNLFAYSLQKEPFIHVDGDVYIPGKLDHLVDTTGLLLAENKANIYSEPLQGVLHHIILKLIDKPDYLTGPPTKLINIFNLGIFGGNDISFILDFAGDCLKTLHSNTSFIKENFGFGLDDFRYQEIHLSDVVNLLFGAYMFTAFTARKGKRVVSIFDTVDYTFAKNIQNILASTDLTYIHPVFTKRSNAACHQLEQKLRQHYPAYYYKILSLINDFSI